MYLVCPLCGLHSHLNRFKPEELRAIIELIEMRSLGRARGWEVSARFSALDDADLMNRIANRCRKILEIIGEEVTEKSSVAALEKKLEKWRKEALGLREIENQLRDEIVELEASVDGYEEEMDGILVQVNDELSDVYEDDFSDLESAVKALIVEYREAMEELEDYEAEEAEHEDDDEDNAPPMTALDRELQIG